MPKKDLNIQQAADLLGVSVKTIRRHISNGNIKAYKFGRLIRIKPEDLKTGYREIPNAKTLNGKRA
ncbi:excisionase family DNA binding domain-containing protein [Propionimicrobium lymphophilum ACS-093-V-SCH5]|uniref:Excisionase family DNA binding domain-containing protein n=1 Tax=Propionimicrobium lymphophilum ACS-093-V-SCH5 TaxID=883161 RepID=S2WXV2_9ACTN|nr:helix-turn-helix domain-containing protein [Propionimicrobium lymphophilum]EPD32599.1 excisionase family DNA binding domain-containing protein [Propionimicrobium lymphophilum ACS-093-V-SCH5]